MSILSTGDFSSGKYYIPINTKQTINLQTCIDLVESNYLVQLMGVELYDLFIADLVNDVPVTPKYLKIFEPFNDQTNDCLTISDGMKEMLRGFVYYTYLSNYSSRASTTGLSIADTENSTTVSAVKFNLNQSYNEAVTTYKVIQNYMVNVSPSDYEEFEGVNLIFNHGF